jgi:hypothetical protein
MAHFVRSFDCKEKEHVLWLKRVGKAMAKSIDGSRVNIMGIVNENPLPGKPSMENPMDWAYVHFQLAMKYTTAVLDGEAFVPPILA